MVTAAPLANKLLSYAPFVLVLLDLRYEGKRVSSVFKGIAAAGNNLTRSKPQIYTLHQLLYLAHFLRRCTVLNAHYVVMECVVWDAYRFVA